MPTCSRGRPSTSARCRRRWTAILRLALLRGVEALVPAGVRPRRPAAGTVALGFATPELLEIERRLIEAAVGRAGEQAATVRDITQAADVVVVSKAGPRQTVRTISRLLAGWRS